MLHCPPQPLPQAMSQPALHGKACKVCRRRGRKCDRTLPTCLTCEKRGVQCEGYALRWPGVAARGKLAGKAIPVAEKDKPAVGTKLRQTRRNSKLATRNEEHLAGQSNLDQYSCDANLTIQEPSAQFDQAEIDTLVGHYVSELSNIFYLGDGPDQNPMSNYVLPLIDTVPPIRYALAASAACHIAARTSDDALDRKSLSLRVHATHLMRERLEDPTLTTYETMLPSILMLAQVDMCSGDCNEFEHHMRAAVAICRDHRADHASNRFYFEQRLAWLDLLSSTTTTRPPFFTPEELKQAFCRISRKGVREWSFNVFPCPVDLCEMLLDTSLLFKNQGTQYEVSTESANAILERLESWSNECPHADGPKRHLVQAWRLGIMAYLIRLFPAVKGDQADSATRSLAGQVLYHARQIPRESPRTLPLLWPIFQVGVNLDDSAQEEKAWMRSYLNRCLDAVGCRHFSNALETLESVWSHRRQLGLSSTATFGRTIMLG